MAKAKKVESAPAAKKPAKQKNPAPAAQPLVDTGLAAQAAAKRVVAGLAPATAMATGPMPESASFKHLKDSLTKPAASGLAGMLDKTAGPGSQKKSNLPFHGGKQQGRNQTFGADVNRTGVPRRTGGG